MAGVRQHQFVRDGAQDDAGHDRDVQVGVGEPRYPTTVHRMFEMMDGATGAGIEIQPPHRHRAGEGREEGQ